MRANSLEPWTGVAGICVQSPEPWKTSEWPPELGQGWREAAVGTWQRVLLGGPDLGGSGRPSQVLGGKW